MFTGLVEEVGEIIGVQRGAEAATLTIKAKKGFGTYKNGRQHCLKWGMSYRNSVWGRPL